MEIFRARTAGFCMGVSLALHRLDKTLAETKNRVVMFGPIIHNPQVLKHYKSLGVFCTENIAFIQPKDQIIIRAHGLPKLTELNLKLLGAKIVDATCPKVKQAQLAIESATLNKQTLLLFGESEHPEVKGLISYANALYFVFDNLEQLKNLNLNQEQNYVLAAQTTQDILEFENISDWLKSTLKNITILTTICDATKKRQDEALNLAQKVEVMIIVGGKDSGNTRRLAALSSQAGVATQHIEIADDLDLKSLKDKTKIGLSAGASTPNNLINEVEERIKNLQ